MPDGLTRLEEMTLVLLHQTAFGEVGGLRCWKGYSWEAMNRLHEKGLITNPVGKAKSIFLTDAGQKHAETLLERYVGGEAVAAPAGASSCACGCGGPVSGGEFLPGHDQKLRAVLESRVGGLLALRELVDAAESYADGDSAEQDLTRSVRALFAEAGSRRTRR